MYVDDLKQLPPLPSLPVLRGVYCSQEVTDNVLQYLWNKVPEFVLVLLRREHSDFDQTYLMDLARIVDFLRKEACKDISVPESHLGMVDLLFELSRRLRKIRGISEYRIKGHPLIKSPDEPWPELPWLPIELLPNGRIRYGVTQEIADRVIADAYKKRPDLFFEFAEILRRGSVWGSDVFSELKHVFRESIQADEHLDNTSLSTIGGEVNRRLRKICEI